MFMCGTSSLCVATKFIMDIKYIYILYFVMFEPFSSAKCYSG